MAADPAPDAARDAALLADAVQEAAEVALRQWQKPLRVWTKPDATEVSEADIATDEALAAILRAARPSYGWLSEELGVGAQGGRRFIVDPIDGTAAYVKGEDEWTVVAAVVEGARPVAGAIFRPVTGTLYTAALGGGAFRDGVPARIGDRDLAAATVFVPMAAYKAAGLAAAGVSRARFVPSLALRLALLAERGLDGVVTKVGPHHWDLAAADLFVHEAGGTLTTLSGEPLRYDTAETRHPPTVAAGPRLGEALRRAVGPHLAATA